MHTTLLKKMCLACVLTVLGGVAGCGPVEPEAEWRQRTDSSVGENGLAFNGLALNGLAFNGLAFNGLALNGLTPSALGNSQFSSWFQQNPELAERVMRYLVRCAVPAGQSLSYWDVSTGQGYTWEGQLGLAPDWASGAPVNLAEQQLITACLAVHVNKYGVSLPVSVTGRDALGTPIPYTADELAEFPEEEACFFGNVFDGTGIFVGNMREPLNARESTARACALSSRTQDVAGQCPPLVFVGKCERSCKRDPSGVFFSSCTYEGVSYQPLTTRLRSQEIYFCGDGTCQFTESCGTSRTSKVYDNCGLDCGPCQ